MSLSREDGVLIYPTDTVWGIGGCILSKKNYDEINIIKNINTNKPVSILFSCIDHIREYFELPKSISDEWMKSFFNLETTLGLPLKWAKKDIPSWIFQESDFVCIRCLQDDFFKTLVDSLKGKAVITTSLNLSGDAPILNKDDAQAFREKHAPSAKIVPSDKLVLSGHSSTIVRFLNSKEIQVIRKGQRFEDVLKQLEILSARVL